MLVNTQTRLITGYVIRKASHPENCLLDSNSDIDDQSRWQRCRSYEDDYSRGSGGNRFVVPVN